MQAYPLSHWHIYLIFEGNRLLNKSGIFLTSIQRYFQEFYISYGKELKNKKRKKAPQTLTANTPTQIITEWFELKRNLKTVYFQLSAGDSNTFH